MLDRLVTFALTQRVFVLLLAAALLVFGLRALDDLPIEAFPDVQDVQVQVVTQYAGPGARGSGARSDACLSSARCPAFRA